MKKNICLLVFLLTGFLAVGLRAYEILGLTQYETGFIMPERYKTAVVVTVIIALAVLFAAVFTCANVTNGKKHGGFYLSSCVTSFALGLVAVICETGENFAGVPGVLRILCVAFSILSAIYFIAFSLRTIVHFPFSARFAVIPGMFFVLKAATVAVKGAYRTVISDTLFEIAAYCFIMLFFLEFARVANGVVTKGGVKKFAAFGVSAAIFSFTASIPQIIILLTMPSVSVHSSSGIILLFFTGLYISSEVFSRLAFDNKGEQKVSLYYIGKH